ncbi:MAG: LysE family translocator [Pseudomonadota bacterium]
MTTFLTTGIILGLSAGFAPGPLLTLVITETLRHGLKAGVKVAIAPVLTDLPIILLTLFILSKLSNFRILLGIISFLGGFLILYLGYESIRTKGVTIDVHDHTPGSLKKGIMVNALNPHPYLFWLGVGAPTVMKAMDHGVLTAAAFTGSFYVMLVGSKISLAMLVGRSRTFLTAKAYVYTVKALGAALCALSIFLFRDGLKLTGLL